MLPRPSPSVTPSSPVGPPTTSVSLRGVRRYVIGARTALVRRLVAIVLPVRDLGGRSCGARNREARRPPCAWRSQWPGWPALRGGSSCGLCHHGAPLGGTGPELARALARHGTEDPRARRGVVTGWSLTVAGKAELRRRRPPWPRCCPKLSCRSCQPPRRSRSHGCRGRVRPFSGRTRWHPLDDLPPTQREDPCQSEVGRAQTGDLRVQALRAADHPTGLDVVPGAVPGAHETALLVDGPAGEVGAG